MPEFRNRPRWKNAMVFLHDEHEDVSLFAEDVCKLAIVRKQSLVVVNPSSFCFLFRSICFYSQNRVNTMIPRGIVL